MTDRDSTPRAILICRAIVALGEFDLPRRKGYERSEMHQMAALREILVATDLPIAALRL